MQGAVQVLCFTFTFTQHIEIILIGGFPRSNRFPSNFIFKLKKSVITSKLDMTTSHLSDTETGKSETDWHYYTL